jgi:hypothetical protein
MEKQRPCEINMQAKRQWTILDVAMYMHSWKYLIKVTKHRISYLDIRQQPYQQQCPTLVAGNEQLHLLRIALLDLFYVNTVPFKMGSSFFVLLEYLRFSIS